MGESAAMIAQPILIGYFIEWMLGDGPLWEGIALGCGLVLASFAQAVVHHLLYYTTMKSGWNCRIAFTGLIHNKLLRLHSSYTSRVSTGFVINLIATDVQRFDMAATSLHFGWMAAVDLLIIGAIIIYHVGYRAGLAVRLCTHVASKVACERWFHSSTKSYVRRLTSFWHQYPIPLLPFFFWSAGRGLP
jgi:ATP-binding cassette subfamily C (CFTR/MRP) protein 4